MNILVIDQDEKTLRVFEALNNSTNDNYIIITDFKNALVEFESYEVDVVIVDYFYPECKDFLDAITKIKPKQRTITLSKEIGYSESKGCEQCQLINNRRRLLKPFNVLDLIHLLKSFDNQCKYFKSMDSIESILGDIIKRLPNGKYNQNEKILTFNSKSYLHTDLSTIVDLLDKHKLEYKILNLSTIKIL